MNLGMGLTPSLKQLCTICNASVNQHASWCPQGYLEFCYEQLLNIHCPLCKGKDCIQINKNDYYECEKCNTQFSSSRVVIGEDSHVLERVCLLEWKASHPIPVLVLSKKGKGIFPLRRTIEDTKKKIKSMKKGKKDSPIV